MKFFLKIKTTDPELGLVALECLNVWHCEVVYKRSHSPTLYYIQPPVVYYESTTEVWFDPKGTMGIVGDLASDDFPFINARVGGSLLDFEFKVDDTT
jgi:hypothetical protein